VQWSYHEADEEQVKDVLVTIDGVTAKPNPYYNNTRLLWWHERVFWLDRVSSAERLAWERQQAEEKYRKEQEKQRKREDDAVAAVMAAKFEKMRAPPCPRLFGGNDTDPEAQAAFEALRRRVEAEVDGAAERARRASWAPSMVIGDELQQSCIALGWIGTNDIPIARLWANFADPKRPGTILREELSNLPLDGIGCRSFMLSAGSERGGVGNTLFEAQRTESGEWQFGPNLYLKDYESPHRERLVALVRERVRCQDPARLTQLEEEIAAIDAEDLIAAEAFHAEQRLQVRAVELAAMRVVEFAGSPGVQMRLAGRLTGNCFCCDAPLRDRESVEYGIGPICLKNKIKFIRDHAALPVDVLAFTSDMPEAFVIEVLAGTRNNKRGVYAHE
jgi:hypothetical protein